MYFFLLSEWYWMLCLIPTFHFKKGNILKLEKVMTPILRYSPAICLTFLTEKSSFKLVWLDGMADFVAAQPALLLFLILLKQPLSKPCDAALSSGLKEILHFLVSLWCGF